MLKKLVFITSSFLLFISCDTMREREAIENYTSPYMGVYVGRLSSPQVSGTLVIDVKKGGSVEITKTILGESENYIWGTVSDGGAIAYVNSPYTGFVLEGSLNTNNGTWRQGNWSGTWYVIKNK